MITTQRELRRAFWRQHPTLPRRRLKNYLGTGLMHCTETRSAFVDWLDALAKNGEVSYELALRVTLD